MSMSGLEVVPCGTAAGGVPRPGGAGTGYLFRTDGTDLLVDVGNGVVGNLARHVAFEDLDGVVVTHTHADHTSDLMALLLARSRFDPVPLLVPPDGEAFVEGFVEHFSGTPDLYLGQAEISEYDPRGSLQVGDIEVETFPVQHSRPAHAVRVRAGGDVVCFSADTRMCDGLVEAARDVDLLICEASFPDVPKTQEFLTWHLSGVQAGEVAAKAGASRLALTHVVYWADPEAMIAEARQAFDGPVEMARENEPLSI